MYWTTEFFFLVTRSFSVECLIDFTCIAHYSHFPTNVTPLIIFFTVMMKKILEIFVRFCIVNSFLKFNSDALCNPKFQDDYGGPHFFFLFYRTPKFTSIINEWNWQSIVTVVRYLSQRTCLLIPKTLTFFLLKYNVIFFFSIKLLF